MKEDRFDFMGKNKEIGAGGLFMNHVRFARLISALF
jgi:hypothetical protein